jgi:CHAP domain
MQTISALAPEQIVAFQATHKDWTGHWLKPDGVAGPKTLWAWQIAQLEPWRQDVVARATSRVGVREFFENAGTEIEEWQKRAGASQGDPWCACFASWCISVPGLPDVRMYGAQALGKSLQATSDPLPGDVLWFPTGSWQGHCGIVIASAGLETASVEGNLDNQVGLARRLRGSCRYGMPRLPAPPPRIDIPPGLTFKETRIVGTR